MSAKAVFYHAGCPVCVDAEQNLVLALAQKAEIVHLGQQKEKINEAEAADVKSVPALVMDGKVYHINFGANLSDLK